MMQEIRVQYNQNKGGEERDIIWKPQGSGKRAKGKNACGKQKPLPTEPPVSVRQSLPRRRTLPKRIQCSHSRSGQVHPLRKMCKILPYEGADTGIKKRRRTQNGDTNNYER